MTALPPTAQPYHRTADFTESSIPSSLVARKHATKPGVWERIRVKEGRLRCHRGGADEQTEVLEPSREVVLEPGVPHRLELLDEPVRVFIEFLRSSGVRGHWSARDHASQ